MRHWLFPIMLLLLISFAAHAIGPLPFRNNAERLRFQSLTSQLRCLVCQNESLASSNAKLAQDLRALVFKMMQAGKTNQQIKQYLVNRYSDYVLYDPPLKPSNYALWFGPFIFLILGGVGVLLYLRKRTSSAAAAPTTGDDDW